MNQVMQQKEPKQVNTEEETETKALVVVKKRQTKLGKTRVLKTMER